MKNINNHPCFNHGAHGTSARIHLPVAPSCNIQCNFCNRKHDCVNESRPGVTSAVLSPTQALEYLEEQCALREDIKVVGIAGPGDPLADAERTLETLRLVRQRFPDMLLCLATNGLRLPDHLDALIDAEVSHVTVTVNAVDPAIAQKIYAWIRVDEHKLHGWQAASHLLSAQEDSIRKLADSDITVKINTIVIPGVNDSHVIDVARSVHGWGVNWMNCMPLKPTADTAFEDISEPSDECIARLRRIAGRYVPQMTHCTRCRADACGKLGENNTEALESLRARAAPSPPAPPARRYAAVASRDGYFVNQHLGEADELLIYQATDDSFDLVDVRLLPECGGGDARWLEASAILNDCRSVVVSGVGPRPREQLAESGLEVVEAGGLIADVLEPVFEGRELPPSAQRCLQGCGSGCAGTGLGCG